MPELKSRSARHVINASLKIISENDMKSDSEKEMLRHLNKLKISALFTPPEGDAILYERLEEILMKGVSDDASYAKELSDMIMGKIDYRKYL